MAHMPRYIDFQPSIEWTEDSQNHVLRIYLPGFRKGEFKVQVTECRKLTVVGRRSLGDGKFMHLERVFAVPEDTQIDKIRGKFGGGCLSLFMPKRVPGKPTSEGHIQTRMQLAGDKKEEAPLQEGQARSSARTEEHPVQKAIAKGGEGTKAAAPAHEEKAKGGEETKAAAPVDEEKKPAAPVHEQKPLKEEKKEEHPIQVELIKKQQPTTIEVSVDRFEKCKEKGLTWKETIVADVEWWLDDGLMDGLWETISTNKKVIAIAVAAFSTGFFVSQKLRPCGRR